MLLFDTYVQKLKCKVLKEVARHDYAGTLQDCYLDKMCIRDSKKRFILLSLRYTVYVRRRAIWIWLAHTVLPSGIIQILITFVKGFASKSSNF